MSSDNLQIDNIAVLVIERIKQAFQLNTDAEVAKHLGVDRSTLATWKRRNTINYELVLAKCHSVSFDWLLRGEGSVRGMQPFSLNTRPSSQGIPLFLCPVPAGAPSPASDHVEDMLNIGELLLPHPEQSFACRVTGDSMVGAGIGSDDIIIVDRLVSPSPGDIVVATVDGELTLKRLRTGDGRTYLFPENERYQAQDITDRSVTIWGVVIWTIKAIR